MNVIKAFSIGAIILGIFLSLAFAFPNVVIWVLGIALFIAVSSLIGLIIEEVRGQL